MKRGIVFSAAALCLFVLFGIVTGCGRSSNLQKAQSGVNVLLQGCQGSGTVTKLNDTGAEHTEAEVQFSNISCPCNEDPSGLGFKCTTNSGNRSGFDPRFSIGYSGTGKAMFIRSKNGDLFAITSIDWLIARQDFVIQLK
jgi:hypothetical protein